MNNDDWVHYTVHNAVIERAEKAERASRMDASAFRTLCSAIQQIEEMVGIDSGGWNGPGEALMSVEDVVKQRDMLREALECIANAAENIGGEHVEGWAQLESSSVKARAALKATEEGL